MSTKAQARPRASVVMSVYNGEHSVKEAIESILGQTFADFEFIIIDDGSTDQTRQLLASYAEQDSRIALLCNETNMGLTRSLNKGLDAAVGDYIVRQDADDVSLPERLSAQIGFLEEHPDVAAVGSAVRLIDGNGRVGADAYSPPDHESICAHLLLTNCLCHTALVARSSPLKQIGGYDSGLPYSQDYDLWSRLSRTGKLHALSAVLVCRGTSHPEAIGVKRRLEQLGCALQISLRNMRQHLQERAFDEAAYERFWWAYHGYPDRLERGDMGRLQPLWEALAAQPVVQRLWGSMLIELAGRLFYSRPRESYAMLNTALRQFKHAVFSVEIAGMAGDVVTAPLLQLCRRIKAFGMSNLKSEIPSAARTE